MSGLNGTSQSSEVVRNNYGGTGYSEPIEMNPILTIGQAGKQDPNSYQCHTRVEETKETAVHSSGWKHFFSLLFNSNGEKSTAKTTQNLVTKAEYNQIMEQRKLGLQKIQEKNDAYFQKFFKEHGYS
ncbi:hypothetical protein D5R81_05365 [Parashewanella spongiae]|uniref:Uncharacterized protein n=1 Tax=Parashewanella spongiae TaxID=342950 RepID=A0A3A6UHH0_9GAMM|nr:hypothetical protein [Parashewanella spongiae]MCL1079559.1 hypothetical protein [Parashewanella spongiae]RJY18464.1 hypothetical protein D5R81_05365 [Parashewanella spongiae]